MLLRKNRYSITILTIILSLTCLSLSFWQFKRLNWKKNLIENLDLAYESSPANIKEFKGDLYNFKFKKITAEGSFINKKNMFLGPRVYENKVGYNLITPFLLKDNRYLLINRGWIEKKINISENNKQITIEGIIKESDKRNIFTPNNDLNKNLWYYINTKQMSEFTGLNITNKVFIDLTSNNSFQEENIIINSRRELSNNHFQYALTWLFLALIFLIMNFIYYKQSK